MPTTTHHRTFRSPRHMTWRRRMFGLFVLREGLFSYHSPWSVGSLMSVGSAGSISSRASSGSVSSIASAGSVASIGSFGSMVSIASVRSIASIASVGCVLSIGSQHVNGAFFNVPVLDLLRGRRAKTADEQDL